MKKIIFTLIMVLGVIGVQAQGGFVFGLKGGANYANIAGKNADDDAEYKFGINAGLAAGYNFSDMVGLRLEGYYSNKGFKYETNVRNNGTRIETDRNTTINYIDMPLLLRIKAGPLFFDLGPQIGFLVGGKEKLKITEHNESTDDSNVIFDQEVGVRKRYEKNDFGYVAGIGFGMDNGLGISLRYNGGFKTINRTENNDPDKIRNSVFQASLEYNFMSNR